MPLDWKRDNGWIAKVGPYQVVVDLSAETDRPSGKRWDIRIWRSGITVATDLEHETDEAAKAKAPTTLRELVKRELGIIAQIEHVLE